MFLHLSASHSVHRGGLYMMALPDWLPGPMLLPEVVPVHGVSIQGSLCPVGDLCLGGEGSPAREVSVRVPTDQGNQERF